MKSSYTECEKMAEVKDQSQIIGEFLDWAAEELEFYLCVYSGYSRENIPIGMSTEVLLSKFFDIDLDEVKKEKRQMLDEIRREK